MNTIALARIHGVNDLRLDCVPRPACGADDVIVQVRHCGLCGSDLSYLASGGLNTHLAPQAIGHEFWGVVAQAGKQVTSISEGQRVVVQPVGNGRLIGNGGAEGGFSPYVRVSGVTDDPDCLHLMPASMPDAYGALVEPLAVAQHSANRVAAKAGDKAVIFGAGPIGLSLLLVLQYRGLENIIVVDLSSKRLALAASLGAHTVYGDADNIADTLIEQHGTATCFGQPMAASDVYFEATGVRSVFEHIVNLAAPDSRICLTGLHQQAASLNLMLLLAKELSIIAAMGYQREFSEVMTMLRSGRLDPSVMVSHQFPLSELHQAFAAARDQEQAVKVIIDCQA